MELLKRHTPLGHHETGADNVADHAIQGGREVHVDAVVLGRDFGQRDRGYRAATRELAHSLGGKIARVVLNPVGEGREVVCSYEALETRLEELQVDGSPDMRYIAPPRGINVTAGAECVAVVLRFGRCYGVEVRLVGHNRSFGNVENFDIVWKHPVHCEGKLIKVLNRL